MTLVSPTQVSDGTTADASDVNTPINQLAAVINGNIDNSNIVAGAAIDGAKLAANSIDIGAKASTWDGWIAVTDTWTYASSTTVTVPSDATAKYSVGDKVKFVQTSTKYFYVTAVASTTLTLNGGSDYTVANAAISSINYSKAETPLGFPDYFNFTPSWTNLTVGSGTNEGDFSMSGHTVTMRFRFIFGAGSAMAGATPSMTLPVTAVSYGSSTWCGSIYVEDAGSAGYVGTSNIISTTAMNIQATGAGGTYATTSSITTTTPFTWATSDFFAGTSVYQAA